MRDKLKEILIKHRSYDISTNTTATEILSLFGVSKCTDLEWSLYTQVINLKEEKSKLQEMIERGLTFEDLKQDI